MTSFTRLDPEEPCIDLDNGHDLVDDLTYASPIPQTVVCTRCGREGTVVVFEDDDAPATPPV